MGTARSTPFSEFVFADGGVESLEVGERVGAALFAVVGAMTSELGVALAAAVVADAVVADADATAAASLGLLSSLERAAFSATPITATAPIASATMAYGRLDFGSPTTTMSESFSIGAEGATARAGPCGGMLIGFGGFADVRGAGG